LDNKGYVPVRGLMNPGDYHTATNVPGIFAAGDCVDFSIPPGDCLQLAWVVWLRLMYKKCWKAFIINV